MKSVLVGVAVTLLANSGVAATISPRPGDIERDWLLSADLLTHDGAATRRDDAAGGCDGIKNGKYGFHTAQDANPWWQVNLGGVKSIGRVVIWNRCDVAARASRLELKLSDDALQWRTVYRHNGKVFFGKSDGAPLEIEFKGEAARFLRVQLPGNEFLHLDEVEVFGPDAPQKNLALNCAAEQSSVSAWSVAHAATREPDWAALAKQTIRQREALLVEHGALEAPLTMEAIQLGGEKFTREHYLQARAALRELLLADPLLGFDDLLFVKRAPGSFSHMSDQYYGWWSRPGGGVFVLKNWKRRAGRSAELICLTPQFPAGSFLKPELSFDARRVLFSYARFHPGVRENKDKTDKARLPEDAFYHVFEMNIDGSHVRQLTRGHYDDFNARYLPNGEIVFLSTRRGTFVQAGQQCATRTLEHDALPDSYVRCGGGNSRPVAVYTLHVMDRSGGNLRAISPFENFEWDPVVANDGRIVYARWDYVDRDNMPYMSLWSTNPDGTNPQLVYGNHTKSPYGVFEARPIPNSRKFVFTASAHHSISGGSLCLLDPERGTEGAEPLTRLTPEVKFPEIEGWSQTWYATPFALSEQLFLTSWSPQPQRHEGEAPNSENALGLYVYHASGARELLYRDPNISSCDPMPVRSRRSAPAVSSGVEWAGAQHGRFLLLDVYQGLEGVERGTVKALRIVGVPAKVQPQMNVPVLGVTADDPGKFVLGTVPVERDGSAHFAVPSGVNVFFQALDKEGRAIQTMRTVSYVQPGQIFSCVGCHEHRATAPLNHNALAAARLPSKLTPAPDGSWPFRFDRLVQPVIESKCIRCHNPAEKKQAAAKFDLTSSRAYESLINYGKPSLRDHVRKRYAEGRSIVNEGVAQNSALLGFLEGDAVHKKLLAAADRERFITWMDVYGQRLGSFSEAQERELAELRTRMADLVDSAGDKQ